MYKLTVIAGPNRGTSYAVQNGENSIGRQTGNQIVLASSKVSKKHCTLVVDNGELLVKDQGSSNGTFVNGILTKLRKIKSGDRISVGEFVLELTEPVSRPSTAPAVPSAFGGNVVQLQFPGSHPQPMNSLPGAADISQHSKQMPKD
ncbi:MAG: FHA domain-containing protein, partial [Bdellovibrionota bacterium]